MAERGDIVIVGVQRSAYGKPPWWEYQVGAVTDLTGEGRVGRWQVRGAGARPIPRNARLYIVRRDAIDVEAALSAVPDRGWPPYRSLAAVRTALRPYLTSEKPARNT